MTAGPDGQPIVALGASLITQNATELCLLCHAYGDPAVLGDDPLLPPPEKGAGSFVFLLEDNLNDAADGASLPIPGEVGGHNVVALGFGLIADSRWATAPGGSYPANRLGCTSCHDPHGNQEFRFLQGAGSIDDGAFTFAFPAPQAEGIDPSVLSQSEADDNHTAYRAGLSNWCGNCHGLYHQKGLSDFEHPSDEPLSPEVRQRYNEYAGDDFPTQGFPNKAYLAAVPFEDPTAATDSQEGPTGTSRVMCLTCHRAHASSGPGSGRWDFNVDLLQDDGFASGSWPIPNPYNSSNQGSLCSKCHLGPEQPVAPGEGLERQIPSLPQPD